MTTPGAPWWGFATAGRIAFGAGTARLLPEVVAHFGSRVLICTDRNLTSTESVAGLLAALERQPGLRVRVLDEGEPEIGFDTVERFAADVRSFEPSVVIGVGGGSNIDLAKVLAGRLTSDRSLRDWTTEGAPQSALPVVAVPTTAGSGSEVTPIAVLTDDENQLKVGFSTRAFLPRAVLVDPILAVTCPPKVTADSGIDALAHAVEAYMAIDWFEKPTQGYDDNAFYGRNPLSDALALRSVELITQNLPTAVAVGSDLAAREGQALGSLFAGMAFSNAGTGIVHALQYPLGVLTKTTHGRGNATLLPAAVLSNLAARQAASASLARAMGCTTADDETAAAALPGLIGDLALGVGITPNLRSIGVQPDQLPGIAATAVGIARLVTNNPRPIDEAGLLAVLETALDFTPDGGL